jgi:DNA-binding transcriptional MerR regulator
MRIGEVAQLFRVTPRRIRAWVRAGNFIEPIQAGFHNSRLMLFSRQAVLELLNGGRPEGD